jgi:hypothetical protein
VGVRGATGGAGPARLPLAPVNLRSVGWLPQPWPAGPIGPPGEPSGCPHAGAFSPDGVPVQRQSPDRHGGDCARPGAPDQSIPQAAILAAAERQYPMSTDDSQWVTRKVAAALGRCSQDSIERTVKKHKLQTRTNDAKATLLNLDDMVRVGRVRAEDLAAGGTGAECAELVRTKEEVSQLRTEVGRQGGRLAEREAFLDLLRQQVGEKDSPAARPLRWFRSLSVNSGCIVSRPARSSTTSLHNECSSRTAFASTATPRVTFSSPASGETKSSSRGLLPILSTGKQRTTQGRRLHDREATHRLGTFALVEGIATLFRKPNDNR